MGDDAEYRKQAAEYAVQIKIRSDLMQMQSMVCSKVNYEIEQIKGAVEALATLPLTIIDSVVNKITEIINDVMEFIDSAISQVTGLLKDVLRQTAIAEKLILVGSEHRGFQKQTIKVSLGIANKVKDMTSINSMIKYDNFANSAIRISVKSEALEKLVGVVSSAVKTGEELLGLANKLLNSVSMGTIQTKVSFPSLSSILPSATITVKVPIPQITCPSLPSFPEISEKEKMDERSTVQAVKNVKLSVKSELLDKLSSAIKSISDTVSEITETVTEAIDTVSSAISEIENTITEAVVAPIQEALSVVEEVGSVISNIPTSIELTASLDAIGLDASCNFSFSSGLSASIGLDSIAQPIQDAVNLVADTRNYIIDTVDKVCDIIPVIDCDISIPNNYIEAAEFLNVELPVNPIPEINVNIDILPKSSTEPVG